MNKMLYFIKHDYHVAIIQQTILLHQNKQTLTYVSGHAAPQYWASQWLQITSAPHLDQRSHQEAYAGISWAQMR